MERNYHDEELYKMAQKKIKEIKGFYVHLIVYILVNIFIFVVNTNILSTKSIHIEFGHLSLPFFWGIGLFAHWASVFGPNIFLGRKWEERKINEILEKEKKQRKQWE
ncbi:2TM domain-containing protein [uncultured Planktosalinus sp.]|uniref:2TM domain-containing protein n=1 Tax=uncultured Planktosalinus sp. TaxID=1810935 RepID=UPI0030DA8E4E